MRNGKHSVWTIGVVLLVLALPVLLGASVSADRFTSTNFTIDAGSVGGSIAGGQGSTNYKLVSSGGESSVLGNASGGSYKLAQGYTAQLENTLQLGLQPSGLAAYYSFDAPLTKTIFDEGPNNLNATIFGSPTQVSGKIGQAISTLDQNSAQSTDTTGLNSGYVTVEAWLNSTDWTTSINGTAVGRWLAVPILGDWQIGRSGSTQFRFGVFASGAGATNISGTLGKTAGVWYHVAGTYDGTTMKIYVNGVLENSSTAQTGALASTSTPLSIGERANQANPEWFGGIDEVKVFNRALSAEEIAAEYNAQNAGILTGLTVGAITPGVSETSDFDVFTRTSAPGYTLAINQNNDLTNGGDTIPGVSGSIASPVTWSEGSTKGLGFTLYGTNATAIPGTWSSGAAYAAFPNSGTTFYTRTGFTAGAKDVLNMRYRLDTIPSQAVGDYTNTVTITGTMTP